MVTLHQNTKTFLSEKQKKKKVEGKRKRIALGYEAAFFAATLLL